MKCPFKIKVCSRCKRILVAYGGNFYKIKNGKYGLASECKKCQSEKSNQWNKNNKEHKKEYMKQYKENNKDKLSEYNKKWNENNKEHKKEYDKQRYEKNKEEIKEFNKQKYEKNKEYFKQYYENNKEEILEKCKQWRENNPEKQFNKCTKRRQLEESQGNGITKEQWYEMMEFFEWKCAYSGVVLNKNRTIDHIIPLSKGGEHEVWNCVPMHRNYNTSKHANDMLEWYIQQEFYSEERLNKIYEWIEYAKNKWQKIM